jgi:hypothetical protein
MAAYSSGVLPLMSMSVLRGVGFLLLILLLRFVPGRLSLLSLNILTPIFQPAPVLTAKKKTVLFRSSFVALVSCERLANLIKGSVGVILAKASAMRVTIPIDLSTRPFIPLPHFFNDRRVPPLLNQSLVLIPEQSDKTVH